MAEMPLVMIPEVLPPLVPEVLFAVIDTGTWPIEVVRSWADALIQAAPTVPTWVMDLSLARTHREASAVVMRAFKLRGLFLPDDLPDLMIGLLYLRLQRGDIQLGEFASKVADVVDAYEASIFDSERWTRESASLESSESLQQVLTALSERASAALHQFQDEGRAGADRFFDIGSASSATPEGDEGA